MTLSRRSRLTSNPDHGPPVEVQVPSQLHPNSDDLTGSIFGRLRVVCPTKERRHRNIVWFCQCDCGEPAFVTGGPLKRGDTRSCGCLQRELVASRNARELTGRRFGRLVALERRENHTKDNCYKWLCKCDCGETTLVTTSHLTSGHTQSCGCLFMDVVRANIGPKNPAWVNGLSGWGKRRRACAEYKHWRADVLERDGHSCRRCGQEGGDIEAHHILSFSEYPLLGYDTTNGAALCSSCHSGFHAEYGRVGFSRADLDFWISSFRGSNDAA